MNKIYCDKCKSQISLSRLGMKGCTLKAWGKGQKCVVTYFTCRTCGTEYPVAVYNDTLKALLARKSVLIQNADNASLEAFKAQRDKLDRLINSEEAVLLEAYRDYRQSKG